MKKECRCQLNRLCRLKNVTRAYAERPRNAFALASRDLDDLVGGVVTRGAALGDVTALDELGDVTTDEGVTGADGVDESSASDDGYSLGFAPRCARRRSRPRLA